MSRSSLRKRKHKYLGLVAIVPLLQKFFVGLVLPLQNWKIVVEPDPTKGQITNGNRRKGGPITNWLIHAAVHGSCILVIVTPTLTTGKLLHNFINQEVKLLLLELVTLIAFIEAFTEDELLELIRILRIKGKCVRLIPILLVMLAFLLLNAIAPVINTSADLLQEQTD